MIWNGPLIPCLVDGMVYCRLCQVAINFLELIDVNSDSVYWIGIWSRVSVVGKRFGPEKPTAGVPRSGGDDVPLLKLFLEFPALWLQTCKPNDRRKSESPLCGWQLTMLYCRSIMRPNHPWLSWVLLGMPRSSKFKIYKSTYVRFFQQFVGTRGRLSAVQPLTFSCTSHAYPFPRKLDESSSRAKDIRKKLTGWRNSLSFPEKAWGGWVSYQELAVWSWQSSLSRNIKKLIVILATNQR